MEFGRWMRARQDKILADPPNRSLLAFQEANATRVTYPLPTTKIINLLDDDMVLLLWTKFPNNKK